MGERPPMRAERARISSTSCGLVGRPPRTSRRYGSTSARLPGPPYAMSSTASWSAAMHQVHDRPDRRDIGLGQHAVAEIENVAGPSPRAREDVADLARGSWDISCVVLVNVRLARPSIA